MQGLLMAAQATFEWALLASFQADLKLFHRTNKIVRLTIENERLRVEVEALKARLRGQALPTSYPQVDAANLPHREVPSPVVVAPQRPFPWGTSSATAPAITNGCIEWAMKTPDPPGHARAGLWSAVNALEH
jgi:hypothetical protein